MAESPPEKTSKLASFDEFSAFLKAFITPRRLMILSCISGEEKTVTQIAEELELQTQVVSQNLSLMLDKGAVILRRAGRNNFYMCSNRKFCQGITLMRAGLEEVFTSRRDEPPTE